MVSTFRTPFADLLPPLSTEEFAALATSIKADGVRLPVFLDESGNVLDGHNRLKIDPDAPRKIIRGLTEAEKKAFVFQCNFVRRNLSRPQKNEALRQMKAVAKALREEDAKKNTQKRVAALLGVARETVRDWFGDMPNGGTAKTHKPDSRVKVPAKEHAKIAERVQAGEKQEQVAADYGVAQSQVSRIATKETKAAVVAKEREATVAALAGADLGIHHGDFRKAGAIVPDGSVDLIFTDPPYDEKSADLYTDLATFAARVLRPGGWCLAYSGHAHLADVLLSMRQTSLEYGWMFAIQHTGGDLRFRKFKLQNKWKPVLGFFMPPLSVWWDWFPDVATGGREKDQHPWQQAEAEAAHFIEALSPAGGIVCDPFVGSGTTCAAAKRLGRQWVGFDIEMDSVKKARVRVNDTATA